MKPTRIGYDYYAYESYSLFGIRAALANVPFWNGDAKIDNALKSRPDDGHLRRRKAKAHNSRIGIARGNARSR